MPGEATTLPLSGRWAESPSAAAFARGGRVKEPRRSMRRTVGVTTHPFYLRHVPDENKKETQTDGFGMLLELRS